MSRRALADVRLAAEGRQVPYQLRRMTEPEDLIAARPIQLEPVAGGPSISSAEVDLAEAALTLAQVTLRRAAVSSGQRIRARLVSAAEPGFGDSGEWDVAWTPWRCSDLSPLGCSFEMRLFVPQAAQLRIELDSEVAPTPDLLLLDVSRPRDELVFVWPEMGEVQLLAGHPSLVAPDYDLALLEQDLLAQPWTRVKLDPSVEQGFAGFGKVVLIGTLLLLVGLLLVAVARAVVARDVPG